MDHEISITETPSQAAGISRDPLGCKALCFPGVAPESLVSQAHGGRCQAEGQGGKGQGLGEAGAGGDSGRYCGFWEGGERASPGGVSEAWVGARSLSTASNGSGDSPCSPEALCVCVCVREAGRQRLGQARVVLGRQAEQAKRTGRHIPSRGSREHHGGSGTAQASGAGAERVGGRQEREGKRQRVPGKATWLHMPHVIPSANAGFQAETSAM